MCACESDPMLNTSDLPIQFDGGPSVESVRRQICYGIWSEPLSLSQIRQFQPSFEAYEEFVKRDSFD